MAQALPILVLADEAHQGAPRWFDSQAERKCFGDFGPCSTPPTRRHTRLMRRIWLLAPVLFLLLTACGGGDTDDGAPADGAMPTGEPTPPAESATETPDESEAPDATEKPEPTEAAPDWPTDPVSVAFTGEVPPAPTLVAVRIGAHPDGGYDRIAMEFEGLPGYEVRYQSEISYDGSGEPVDLTGDAFLQLVFNPAQAHDDEGRSTLPGPSVEPVGVGYQALQSYVLNGDFEGYVSIALGLSDKVGFNVAHFGNEAGNDVVYVDVAHP